MRIWIDLTDFLQWKGNLTGIQRIQFNISKLYKESGYDVRFFTYLEKERKFTEVPFNPDDIVKLGIIKGPKMRKAAHKSYLLNRARLSAGLMKRHIVHGGKKLLTRQSKEVKDPFQSGDILLIIDGAWDSFFIRDLGIVKRRHNIKIIHFAFDMIPSKLPGFVVGWLPKVFTNYMRQAFKISDGIISISESTASDIRDFIKLHNIKNTPELKIVRIGENIDEVNHIKQDKKVEGVDPGFLLSVSTVEARKNHTALFYVYKEAERRGIKLPKIVIVGRNGWQTSDFRHIVHRDPDAKQHIRILNDVDDAELSWLYKNCLLTVFPSFYEGWGMPIAESLSYGKMCLSSDESSMPEIAGDLIDYFSPYDTGAMLDTIVKYLDPQILKNKEKEIKNNYQPTSWCDMYDEVREFVESVQRK